MLVLVGALEGDREVVEMSRKDCSPSPNVAWKKPRWVPQYSAPSARGQSGERACERQGDMTWGRLTHTAIGGASESNTICQLT